MKTRDIKLIGAYNHWCGTADAKYGDFYESPEYAQFLADNPIEGLELWVARDVFGPIALFINEPNDIVNPGTWEGSEYFELPITSFNNITHSIGPVKFRLVREDQQ